MMPRLRRDLRAVIALMTALMLPCFLILLALIVDVGFWLTNSARLQIAADSAAMVAGTMMLTSAYQSQTSAAQITNAITVAAAGAQLGANQLSGTITPTVTIDGPNYTTVTVTLTMPMFSIFGNSVGVLAPTLRATATSSIAPRSCVLALATTGTGITVGTGGTLAGTNTGTSHCPIFSDANIVNSGTLSGYTVGAVGTITGPTTPSTNSPGRPLQVDYLAGTPGPAYTAASPPACTYSGLYVPTPNKSYTTSTTTPTTFCNNNRFLNGGTVSFGAGVYYIYGTGAPTSNTQGFIAFDGTTVTFASGTTFVLLGQNAVIYFYDGATVSSSSALIAPTGGTTSGFAIWQPCTGNGTSTVGPQFGGSGTGTTVSISGTIYAPCNQVTVGSGATVSPPSGSGLSVIANTISVSGASSSLTATATKAILTTPVLVN